MKGIERFLAGQRFGWGIVRMRSTTASRIYPSGFHRLAAVDDENPVIAMI